MYRLTDANYKYHISMIKVRSLDFFCKLSLLLFKDILESSIDAPLDILGDN